VLVVLIFAEPQNGQAVGAAGGSGAVCGGVRSLQE